MHTVSITSQGQITIPAKIRKKLGMSKGRKATVSIEGDKMVVRPTKDLMDFVGTFRTRKKASSRQIRKAFGEHLARQAVSYEK